MKKRIRQFAAILGAASGMALSNAQATVALEGATASGFQVNPSGVGHFLVVPYFTTQAGNAMLLSLINMDEVNGKAVKLRFRSARNADALLDFQVFLAPGDMWTANVSQNAQGLSSLVTEDASCTKPAKSQLNTMPFQVGRLDPSITHAERAAQTREGYVEIVTMADIAPTAGGLFPLIDLYDGRARCADAAANKAWSALDVDRPGRNAYAALGLTPPSTGLSANWTIINVPKALTWSGAALAIEAHSGGKPALGNLAFFPQTTGLAANAQKYSADPLFAGAAAPVAAQMNDLPDLSTPYVVGAGQANQQAAALADLLAVKAVANEFWTEPAIDAATDWVFSMPTRRFAVGRNYKVAKGEGTWIVNKQADHHFSYAEPELASVSWPDGFCQGEPDRGIHDRETRYSANPYWAETLEYSFNFLCDAVTLRNVVSPFGKSVGALHAGTRVGSDRDVLVANGWMKLSTGGMQGNGTPLIGQAFVRAHNPSVAPGTAGHFGVSWPHRLFKD